MATNFPNSIQDLDATRGTDSQNLSTPNHATHHALEDDTIEALQTKVGVNNSAVTSSLDYKLTNASSVSPGHKHVVADFSDYAPISSSTGISDANKVVKTDYRGKINGTILNFSPGDGSDGALSITSGTTTLDSDKQYTSVSVTGTAILNTAGYRIYCQGSFVVDSSSGAYVHNNGGDGGNATTTGGTAGTIAPSVTVPSGFAGKAGANGVTSATVGTAGTAGTNVTLSIGVAGGGTSGKGGDSGEGRVGGAGAGAGTITYSINKLATVSDTNFIDHTSGTFTFVKGSSGSGSGGSGANGNTGTSGGGGGSGASGGCVFIASNTISLTGASCIQAKGGNGGNGGSVATAFVGGGGGGTGGSGGQIVLVCSSKSGSGTLDVSGGAKGIAGTSGSSAGAASDGSAGLTGKTYIIYV